MLTVNQALLHAQRRVLCEQRDELISMLLLLHCTGRVWGQGGKQIIQQQAVEKVTSLLCRSV